MTAGKPDAPVPVGRRDGPNWLTAALVGIGLGLFGLVGFYFGIYFALGGQALLSGLVMFGLVPLLSLVAGWLLRPRFGAAWLTWILVTFGVAVVAELLQAFIIFAVMGNSGMLSRVGLLAVLQQVLGLPFALLSAWLAGRSSKQRARS